MSEITVRFTLVQADLVLLAVRQFTDDVEFMVQLSMQDRVAFQQAEEVLDTSLEYTVGYSADEGVLQGVEQH